MIQRRNTTDSGNGSWPLCKYYYTHNTGSCDDILLYRKETIKRKGEQKKRPNKRYTYPISLRDQRLLLLNKKEKSNQIKRRWSGSGIRRQNKRNTLAGIVNSLSKKKVLPSNDNKQLDEKWELIRSYQDTEKIEQEEEEEEAGGPSNEIVTTPTTVTTVTTPTTITLDTRAETTLINSSVGTNSSIVCNAPSSSAGQETIEEESQVVQQPQSERKSQKEKLLFLSGFLMFPLWWVGAWQYIIQQQDHRPITKDREVFQILNCLMSLASLLLIGLMIGLSTVWA